MTPDPASHPSVRYAALLALTGALATAGAQRAEARRLTEVPVAVNQAWVRLAPPGATSLAGYMLLKNPSNRHFVLHGASSPLFGSVQLHVVVSDGEMVHMRRVDRLPLAPGGTLLFKPGNSHLMFMQPRRTFKVGDTIPLVLDFGRDGRRSLQLKVLNAADAPRF